MADALDQGPPESVLLHLSNEMVRIYKMQLGRGPTKARSAFAGRNTIVMTLEDSFTPVERRLIALGEHQRVRDTRLFFQDAERGAFCAAVERITGREVRGFVSGVDVEHDISTEVFYLQPAG
jgi:uncharacterized protein YbcI